MSIKGDVISPPPKQFTYILEGRIPPKKNNRQTFFKNGRIINIPSEAYKVWHKVASEQIIEQWQKYIRPMTIHKCECINVILFYGDQYGKDNTNTVESVHDLLVDCGIIIDDSWQVTGPTNQIPVFRQHKPGAEILITVDESPLTPAPIKKTRKKKVDP